MPRLVYLLRHSETAWSLSGQHTGRTEIPLTARGEATARNLGAHLSGIPFAHVLVSPRQRAWRTCELADLSSSAQLAADLAEWDYGDFEARRSADIRRGRPQWDLFHDGCPGGERPDQISHRADRLIARLRSLEGNIALFTHGHFGRVFGVRWIGLPVGAARHFLLDPASLSVLGYEHDCPGQPAIVQWNTPACRAPFPPSDTAEGDLRKTGQRALDRWENEGGEIPHVHPCAPTAALTTAISPPPMDRWPTSW